MQKTAQFNQKTKHFQRKTGLSLAVIELVDADNVVLVDNAQPETRVRCQHSTLQRGKDQLPELQSVSLSIIKNGAKK